MECIDGINIKALLVLGKLKDLIRFKKQGIIDGATLERAYLNIGSMVIHKEYVYRDPQEKKANRDSATVKILQSLGDFTEGKISFNDTNEYKEKK